MTGARGSQLIAPGDTHTFKFSVKFIDGGPNGADNAFKSARVTADFNWEAVNN
jgi:hypothetical protein